MPVLDRNLIVKNAPKLSSNYLKDIIRKIKQIQNPEEIYKSAKNVLEKLNPKENPSKNTISKVLSKVPNRNKTSN